MSPAEIAALAAATGEQPDPVDYSTLTTDEVRRQLGWGLIEAERRN